MSGVLQSSVAVSIEQLSDMSEHEQLAVLAASGDVCHCCDVRPADSGGVLCNVCRVNEEKESE